MVAGRVGDDAASLLGSIEADERVEGAPEFERPGPLQVLALEEDAAAGLLIDRA